VVKTINRNVIINEDLNILQNDFGEDRKLLCEFIILFLWNKISHQKIDN
jgi:hypothetical protein